MFIYYSKCIGMEGANVRSLFFLIFSLILNQRNIFGIDII